MLDYLYLCKRARPILFTDEEDGLNVLLVASPERIRWFGPNGDSVFILARTERLVKEARSGVGSFLPFPRGWRPGTQRS